MKKIINNKLTFYIPLILIMFISFLNMYNAKYINSVYNLNLIKQIIWYIIGFSIIIIFKFININKLLKYAPIYYLISIILLVLVLFVGRDINGAKAWFNLGFISFQPSELAKLTLTIYLSKIVNAYHNTGIKSEIIFILKVLLITLIPSILVFLEPDTGAIIYFLIIALTVLISANIHRFWFLLLTLLFIIGLTIFILLYLFNQDLLINLIGTSFFYRVERIITFKTMDSYQLDNALIAIGSAQIFKINLDGITIYIPEAPTDFIFAFTISNFGIITGIIVLILYLTIDIYLINLYFKINNNNLKVITLVFIMLLLFGEIINIGMNLGLLPIIGIPLPFLSYGGSMLIIYFMYLGIILKNEKKPYRCMT